MEPIPYVPRRGHATKQLRELGWVRSRNNRKRRQPEVWKKRKLWTPKHIPDGAELVVRILRVESGMFEAQVRRQLNFMVYWQPIPMLQATCPLTLAVELELEGDAVRHVYTLAKQYKEYVDWIPAPQHPLRKLPPQTYDSEKRFLYDTERYMK